MVEDGELQRVSALMMGDIERDNAFIKRTINTFKLFLENMLVKPLFCSYRGMQMKKYCFYKLNSLFSII